MKKLRIVVGINSLTESQWPAYNSHLQLFYRLGRDNPDMDLCLVNPHRVAIDSMRNSAASVTVNGGFDYLLFLDDDVIPPPDCLQHLINCKADIAAGDVLIRSHPFDHMCFKYTKDGKTMKALSSYPKKGPRVLPVDAVGNSLTLYRGSLLKRIPPPYFITGTNHTEDVYLCLKARDVVENCSIVVDTKLICGHILWPEIISSANKKNYKKYYEAQYPELRQPTKKIEVLRVSSDVNYEDVMRARMGQ